MNNLFAAYIFLCSSYRERMFLIWRTYVLDMENVRSRYGERKSM